jgi:hypothetical protein
LLGYRTPWMLIADMRHVIADVDDRARRSGGGCTLNKRTPRPAAVASEMGHKRALPAFSDQREIDVTFNRNLVTGRAALLTN